MTCYILAYFFLGFRSRDQQNYTAKFTKGGLIKQRQRKHWAVLGVFYEEQLKSDMTTKNGQFLSKGFKIIA